MLFIDQQNTTPVQFSRKSSSRPDSVSAPHTPSRPPPSAPVPRGASAPGRRRLRGPQRRGRGGRRPARRRASLVALCTKQMPREAQHAEMKQSQTVVGNARHGDTRVELIQLGRNDPPAAAALPLPAEDIRHRTAAVLTRVPGLRTACTRKNISPIIRQKTKARRRNLQICARISRASQDQSRERWVLLPPPPGRLGAGRSGSRIRSTRPTCSPRDASLLCLRRTTTKARTQSSQATALDNETERKKSLPRRSR